MQVLDWGLIDYREALHKQEELVEKVADQKSSGLLAFCTHPEVVTLGRKTETGDVFDFHGPVYEISRGGRATYHGPSQLVIYPILNLEAPSAHRPLRDIGWFLRNLENSIIETLKGYHINSVGKSVQKKDSGPSSEETGVWVENRKIASLGIGIRRWTTYHGAAINLDQDPSAFQGLKPCGFNSSVMVSVQELTGQKPDRALFQKQLEQNLLSSFGA